MFGDEEFAFHVDVGQKEAHQDDDPGKPGMEEVFRHSVRRENPGQDIADHAEEGDAACPKGADHRSDRSHKGEVDDDDPDADDEFVEVQ